MINLKDFEEKISNIEIDCSNEVQNLSETNLKELYEMQIAECEMLQSMFQGPNELILDQSVMADIQYYTLGKTTEKPSPLNIVINLDVSDLKLELHINLPSTYPVVRPKVFVRSNQFKRHQQKEINDSLINFISSLEKNEIIIVTIIAWLQENALNFIKCENQSILIDSAEKYKESNKCIFTRLWIYSHHIYSNSKRKKIVDLANNYSLTGFCLPGKPGVICLEGYQSDCEEWWTQIKSMTWKKIMCLNKEEFNEYNNLNEVRKFSNFKEISFNNCKIKKNHMDFGEFFKFLKNNGCEYIFKMYFGVDGK